MKDLLFLSNMFPSGIAEYYASQGFVAGGNNITYIQEALLDGFDAYDGVNCTVLNKMLIRRGKARIPARAWNHCGAEEKKDYSFSYINKPFFSSNLLFRYAKPHIVKWLEGTNSDRLVIAYGLTNYTLSAMAYIKKRDPSAVTAIIVPDLPEHTKRRGKNPFLNIKNVITNYITKRKIRAFSPSVDWFFLFSEAMKEPLDCVDRFSVFEGVATDTFANVVPYKWDHGEKVIVYGGGLHAKYGLDLLMDSFSLLKSDEYRFVLCGNGDYVPEICRRAESDLRIHYMGTVAREELLRYQAGASVLVNPRTGKEEFSRYSFPSKNMEYLSSGVPMIGFKLGGIPDEYDAYIDYPEEETAVALAERLRFSCEEGASEASSRAIAAKKFVLSQKNKFIQAKKMLDAMNERKIIREEL